MHCHSCLLVFNDKAIQLVWKEAESSFCSSCVLFQYDKNYFMKLQFGNYGMSFAFLCVYHAWGLLSFLKLDLWLSSNL